MDKNTQGHWRMMMNGKRVYVHKYVWELINGKVPDGYVLHHGDGKGNFDGEGNKNCNCVANLMLMTRAEHLSLHKSGVKHHMYGKHHSDETKQKMSEARKGRKPTLGMKHTEETKRKISAAGIGRHNTDETKAKMSAARKLYYENKRIENGKTKKYSNP
jgi:hypothetical protein